MLQKSLAESEEKLNNKVIDEAIDLKEAELAAEKAKVEEQGKEQQEQERIQDQIAAERKRIERQKLEKNKKKNESSWVLFLLVSIVLGVAACYFYSQYETQKSKISDLGHRIETHNDNLQNSKVEQREIKAEKESNTEKANMENTSSQSQSSYSSSSGTSCRFPQASERLLSDSDLSSLSKYELKIMRNEIFA